jgi:exonuclease I
MDQLWLTKITNLEVSQLTSNNNSTKTPEEFSASITGVPVTSYPEVSLTVMMLHLTSKMVPLLSMLDLKIRSRLMIPWLPKSHKKSMPLKQLQPKL